MKRILVLILTSFIFLFSSCDILNALLGFEDDEKNNTYTTIYDNSYVYFIKLNTSQEIVKAKDSGYVTKITSARLSDTDSFIQNLNTQFYQNFTESSARSASSSMTAGYNEQTYNLNQTKNFWSYINQIKKTDDEGNDYYENVPGQVEALCKYVGNHCYVFADIKNNASASKRIQLYDQDYVKIGEIFDSCYDLETNINGSPLYETYDSSWSVPCNEKVIILVSDLYGDATEQNDGKTVGYFYTGDLYNQDYLNSDPRYNLDKNENDNSFLHSNECEMFYIDALFLTQQPNTVYSTLVHEFNHMINFIVKSVKGKMSFNTWFTEMLSMTTEDMFQTYLGLKDEDSPKGRLPWFNLYHNYGFTIWPDSNTDDDIAINAAYANTYAFGAFLVRNFGGLDLLHEIATNENVNEESITQALKTCNPDINNIDFNYALEKFSMCFFNSRKPNEEQASKTGENKYLSFNIGTGDQSGKSLGFTPIDIWNIEREYIDKKDGQLKTEKILPYIYEKDEGVSLKPTGFSVHYIDKNITNFVLEKNSKIQYIIIETF